MSAQPHRVVVVGAGMAAGRLVDRLVAAVSRPHVTVVGAEQSPPYNRVLLSAALSDPRRLAELAMHTAGWYRRHNVELITGTRVTAIDRSNRTLAIAGGHAVRYDTLVLATGSTSVLPAVRGVRRGNELHPMVTAFRTTDDCRRLLAASLHAKQAVVIGGGLLGLEAARGLASRGLQVDIVHAGPHLLHDHLDAEASEVLRTHVAALGIGVHTGLHVTAITTTGAELTGVRLSDGYQLSVDLAVITCGTRPASRLARGSGLAVKAGVVVDDDRRCVNDHAVFAIGDCVERPNSAAQAHVAWDDADAVADILCERPRRASAFGHRVLRLRAAGLDVAAIGDTAPSGTGIRRTIRVRNPLRNSYKSLTFDDGKLVGGVLIGDTSGAAELTTAIDRNWLPTDLPSLLLGSSAAAANAATTANARELPDAATVCVCNGITAGKLRAVAEDRETATLEAVIRATRATTGCGSCRSLVMTVIAHSA